MARIAREMAKRGAGWLIARSSRNFTYENSLFILAHMRCGSTALSNILCSRDDVNGYGEAHIRYDGRGALGRLWLNQRLRGGTKPEAGLLFDKILHSRHDAAAPPEFFRARAIFMVRSPEPAIRSICKLYAELGRDEYRTLDAAAAYYVERLGALARLWDGFSPAQRIGLTHGALLQNPDAALAAISQSLNLHPPLANQYVSNKASRQGGGGDPLSSGRYNKIEPALLRATGSVEELGLSNALNLAVHSSYNDLLSRFAQQNPQLAI